MLNFCPDGVLNFLFPILHRLFCGVRKRR